jgi:TetR/AcrR family transcriptional regulator, transcriptional repressor for nem operon
MTTTDTRETIMRAAGAMVQNRGYNALSFRELAAEVGVKSSSVHYHFPTKGDLAVALARRYTDNLVVYLDGLLAASQDQQSCIRSYTGFFRAALLKDNRMCLAGILAAEHADLPVEVRAELTRFAEVNVRWLVEVLSLGKSGADTEAVQRQALAIYAAIEGAQLVARGHDDVAVFDQIIETYRTAGVLP